MLMHLYGGGGWVGTGDGGRDVGVRAGGGLNWRISKLRGDWLVFSEQVKNVE